MFIRRTETRSRTSGEPYFTHRLVEAHRQGKSVKQRTLLNLGTHFDVPQDQWPALAARIEQLLHGQAPLLPMDLSDAAETWAQRIAAQLIARLPADVEPAASERYTEVDLSTLEQVRTRSVGMEHAALSAVRALGFEQKLVELGFNGPQIAAALGNVIGRMVAPGSERATHGWLQQHTALGELLGYDYEGMDLQRLYRSADQLLKHREALESHLFGAAQALFGFGETITLYDLTNTYFEGVAAGIPKAQRGRSKEKRSDGPLVTLALVLDVSGFAKRSRIFAGNVSEAGTLAGMLESLSAVPGATVVMDAGIASEANLSWLKEQGYHYVVVSRKQGRQFDSEQASTVETAGGDTIQLQRVVDPDGGDVCLYCYSPARADKDRAIDTKKAQGLEAALQKIANGLAKPRGTRNPDKLRERIGRLKEKYARAAQHYVIDLTLDDAGKTVTALTWRQNPTPGSAVTHPGVYCLRTTLTDYSDAALWRVYSMLTNLEAVFRCLKTDLGLRPVFHQIERRVEAHLFISVLAYSFVHTLRCQLKAQGIHDSWGTIRKTLEKHSRTTTTVQRRDGRTVHVRKAGRPEPHQQRLYAVWKLPPNPGGTVQTVV